MLAGCASASAKAPLTTAAIAPVAAPSVALPTIQTASLETPPLDPRGHVRKELMERAMTALNVRDSNMSSVGAYATAGANWGAQQGPNVLLDGLEYSNDKARERAIIVHGADYADPAFLAREGKLGRSYGCFSVAHTDLPGLRERMGEGRLLFAWA